jgi:hypothetical protein
MTKNELAFRLDVSALPEALDQVVETGHAVCEDMFTPEAIGEIVSELNNYKLMLADESLGATRQRRSVYLQPRTLFELAMSGYPVPSLMRIGAALTFFTSDYGEQKGVEILQNWHANKAVVNKLTPTEDKLGRIDDHVDPERYSGLVYVVSCAPAYVITKGVKTEVGAGALEMFAAKDLSEAMDIDQPNHAVDTYQPRYSVAFTLDNAPPIGIQSAMNAITNGRISPKV